MTTRKIGVLERERRRRRELDDRAEPDPVQLEAERRLGALLYGAAPAETAKKEAP